LLAGAAPAPDPHYISHTAFPTPHSPHCIPHTHKATRPPLTPRLPCATHYPQDPVALEKYKKFVAKIKDVEKEIDTRNKRPDLKLRSALAYELLAPTSGPGITSRGVPQSISI
jgi:hypothetical protein